MKTKKKGTSLGARGTRKAKPKSSKWRTFNPLNLTYLASAAYNHVRGALGV